MKILTSALFFLSLANGALAGPRDGTLEVVWIDSEGGGSTLIVTPAGESVLIDTGNPGGRDAARIVAAAKAEGLKRIDHIVITHFHRDHFGGAAEVAQLMPVGVLHDKGIPETDPDGIKNSPWPLQSKAYREMNVKREPLHPGSVIELRQAVGAPQFEIRCLGVNQKFLISAAGPASALGGSAVPAKELDTSDNANSAVFLLTFGAFRFFDGGDLTWNLEAKFARDYPAVGPVDLFQVEHHGLDRSNNPQLVRLLAPTVAVMGNGPRKGAEPGTMATLRGLPSLQALFQMHRNVTVGPEGNTGPEYIANFEEAVPPENCPANIIRMSVARDGQHYTVSIPAKNFSRTFATRAGAASRE